MEYKQTFPTPAEHHEGKNTCEFAVVHHTGTGEGTIKGVLNGLTTRADQASCHYVVDTNGDLYKIGNDTDILWHAGKSSRNGRQDFDSMNSYSIGIEIIGPLSDGGFTDEQRKTVSKLLGELAKKYNWKEENILRHKDIAPGRKTDVSDSLWNGSFKTWEAYKASLFVQQIAPDVPSDAWYSEALKWAIKVGITNAGPNKNFEPEKPATRAQIVQFLYNFAKFLGK